MRFSTKIVEGHPLLGDLLWRVMLFFCWSKGEGQEKTKHPKSPSPPPPIKNVPFLSTLRRLFGTTFLSRITHDVKFESCLPLIWWAVAWKAPHSKHSSRVMTKHSDSPGSQDLFLTLSFFEQERRGTFDINSWEEARMPRESAECDGWNVKLIWSVYRVFVHFNDGCDQFHLMSSYRSIVIDLVLVVLSLPLRNGCKTSTRLDRLLK